MSVFDRLRHKSAERFYHARGWALRWSVHALLHFRLLLRWVIFSVILGCVLGVVGAAFVWCISFGTQFHAAHQWVFLLIPFGGLLIVFLYRVTGRGDDKGTNTVIIAVREKKDIPLVNGPLIFVATVLTHAFGGSTVSYLEEKVEGMAKDPNDRMKEYSFQQRYLDYGVGKPDILFFHGGRNDFGQFGGNTDVLLGSYDAESLQAAYDAAPGTLFGNYSQGTVALLRDFHSKFPAAKVLVIVHDQMSDGFEDAAMAITEFMVGKGCDAKCVSLHERGTSNKTNTTIGINKESGTHPNIVGCENMANYVFEQVGSWLED